MEDKVKDLKVKNMMECAAELPSIITSRTNGVEKVQVRFGKGDAIDSAIMHWNFHQKPMYFNYELFGYLHRKNRLDYNFKILNYDSLKMNKEFKFINKWIEDFQNSKWHKSSTFGAAFKFDKWAM